MRRLWIVYAEVSGSEYPNGAFVECFVPEDEIVAAIVAAKSYFRNSKLEVVNIDRCLEYVSDEWDDENDPDREVRNAIKEVQESQAVQTGPFRIWEED